MSDFKPIERVVIVGGGTAGWMTAAAASRFLNDGQRRIELVESEAIGTVGVGEATIPPILGFNALLGIGEREFLRSTGATYKLGIELNGWGREGETYFHQFGDFGQDFEGVAFHQLWLKHRRAPSVGRLADYSITATAAAGARFAHPSADRRSPLSGLAYAYHFDAGLYAAFLRRYAEERGVRRSEGRIAAVLREPQAGHVTAVQLEDGRRIEGDLFIDCSGFRSLLLGGALGIPFEDWSQWLPCDRAIAVPSERSEPLLPFTRATAHRAGWGWRIPLQHRTGNGIVYSSAHLEDTAAEEMLLAALDSPPIGSPHRLSFKAGRRVRCWDRNVVAIGLSSGFLEPLESTSIHLIQTGISKLFSVFPDMRFAPIEREEYNRVMTQSYEAIRDFIILHFHATQRADSDFWNYVRTMKVPDTLRHKMDLFADRGRVFRTSDELFSIPSWVAVMLGQNIVPEGHDPIADSLDDGRILAAMAQLRAGTRQMAERMPSHAEFLRRALPEQAGHPTSARGE